MFLNNLSASNLNNYFLIINHKIEKILKYSIEHVV
jgi:hypothetical protein